MTERRLLTDVYLVTCPPPISGERRIWDTEVIGFCARLYASGKKVFCLKHRVDGQARWITIGPFESPWTATLARAHARELLLKNVEKSLSDDVPSRGLTVRSLVELYFQVAPRERLDKRQSSWRLEELNLKRHLLPALGERHAEELSRADIIDFIRKISEGNAAYFDRSGKRGGHILRGGPGCAEIVLRNTRTLLYWAQDKKIISHNPAQRIFLPRRAPQARSLSLSECKRLLSCLSDLEASERISNPVAAAIRLLLLTGARLTEIIGLRWSEVDFRTKRLVLPPERSKTGGKSGARYIPLNAYSIEILNNLPRSQAHVFPGRKADTHLRFFRRAWSVLIAESGIGRLRVHDLRHTFASISMQNGESLMGISRILGHRSINTTQYYLHVTESASSQISERTANLFFNS